MKDTFPLLHDPPGHDEKEPGWYRIPFFGWNFAYWRQLELHSALVKQAIERGPVPESAWAPYAYNVGIRRTIEKIVIDNAYRKGSTFHLLDRIELMFVLRYGDLNEVQILMAVEDQFGFEIDEDVRQSTHRRWDNIHRIHTNGRIAQFASSLKLS